MGNGERLEGCELVSPPDVAGFDLDLFSAVMRGKRASGSTCGGGGDEDANAKRESALCVFAQFYCYGS